MEPVPEFSKNILPYLRRTEWGDFPDVVIHSDESVVKKHLLYTAAKTGNVTSAQTLALETATIGALE